MWYRHNDNDELRKYAKVYDSINKGDKILCYSAIDKAICAILEAGTKNNDGIDLEFKKPLNVSLETMKAHYDTILSLSPKKYSSFTKTMRNIFYGTFFQTTKQQFDFICALDNSIDNSLALADKNVIKQVFTTRHETGAKAEEIFQKHYKQIPKFKNAKCKDMRLSGVGYDFELIKNGEIFFIEVKGINDGKVCNSVLFTPKEWKVASNNGESYFLVIVNISQNTMQVMQNPSQAEWKKETREIEIYNVNIKPFCDDKNLYKIKDLQ